MKESSATQMTNGCNRRKPSHVTVVGWLNDLHVQMSRPDMIRRAFACCGLRHPSMDFKNGPEYALSLNGRLHDELFIRGSNFDRDTLLLMIVSMRFESNSELVACIEQN